MLGLVLGLVLVLLSRGRDIGTLGVVGHHGHVVVLKAVFLAADLTLEAIPLVLLRRSGVLKTRNVSASFLTNLSAAVR